MTEAEARAWLASRCSDASLQQLERFATLLRTEADRQSLIARSTFDTLWSRHIVDSAQLIELAPTIGRWLDIGSGGGLPGMVVAILRPQAHIVMVDPRRKRVEFLEQAIGVLGLKNATSILGKAQSVVAPFNVISARAVAPVNEIFGWCRTIVSRETRFLLPRGQSAAVELEIAQRAWQGVFHVEKSLTDAVSGIIVAHDVAPR